MKMPVSNLSDRYRFCNVVCIFTLSTGAIYSDICQTKADSYPWTDILFQGFKIPFEANPNLTVEQTNRIFGNIEQLYKFQTSFLAELELANESVSIPAIFVSWAAKFEVYAEYCNNFCLAQHLLARLSKVI